MALTAADVTACLVTRGDVDLAPVRESLPYPRSIVWNNSTAPADLKVLGRYAAALQARTRVVYFQDDDVLFRDHDELMRQYRPGELVAVYAHGDDPAGYEDVAMVGAGALVDRDAIIPALARYLARWRMDDDFLYYCDFAFGLLVPSRQLMLPFEIRDAAYNGRRLADQPWAPLAKQRVFRRAASIAR